MNKANYLISLKKGRSEGKDVKHDFQIGITKRLLEKYKPYRGLDILEISKWESEDQIAA